MDHFLCDEMLMDLINPCTSKPGYRSDHSLIEIKINVCELKRGRGIWKLNFSLLKNKDYLILINNIIDSEKLAYAIPICNPDNITNMPDSELNLTIPDDKFLEILLLKIRGETIKICNSFKMEDRII